MSSVLVYCGQCLEDEETRELFLNGNEDSTGNWTKETGWILPMLKYFVESHT